MFNESLFQAFFQTFLIVLIITMGLVIMFYIFRALGLYKIAKNNGVDFAWMAWIPILNIYILGAIADDYRKDEFHPSSNLKLWLMLCLVISTVCSIITVVTANISFSDFLYSSSSTPVTSPLLLIISAIVSIVYLILYLVALYNVYASSSDKAVLMLVLSIFFSILIPIFLFAIRNNNKRVEAYKITLDPQ